MKTRLFSELPPVERELIFKVFEEAGYIKVDLVDREGKWVQHIFRFGSDGIVRYELAPGKALGIKRAVSSNVIAVD